MRFPKISVITVCRNVGSNLQDTINTVRSQTYRNVEYIIVDGASTDDTVDVIRQNESKIDKWISEPDQGIYDAMNKGLLLATGDWVNFMNVGDSFVNEDIIKKIFESEIPDYVKVIGGNTNNVFADGHVVTHYGEGGDAVKFRMPFSHQSCFVRRLQFDDRPFSFDTRYTFAADYALLYKIYNKYGATSIHVMDFSFANYKQEDSYSLVNFSQTKKEYLRIQASHPNFHWLKECFMYCVKK